MRVVSSRNISTTQTWFWNLNGCVMLFIFYRYWGVPEFFSWLWLCCGVNRQTLFKRRIGFLSIVACFIAVRQWERIVCGFSTSQAHVCLSQVLPLRIFFLVFSLQNKFCFTLVMGGGGFDIFLGPQYPRNEIAKTETLRNARLFYMFWKSIMQRSVRSRCVHDFGTCKENAAAQC